MNLQDLAKLDINDLQKIDYNQLLGEIKKKPDILVAVVLIVGSLIFAIGNFQKGFKELRSLRGQINVLQKKTTLIRTYNDQKKELGDFLEKLPKVIPDNDLIATLTDMAVHRGVKIESFSPATGRDAKLYKTASLKLEVVAESYQQIWLFTRDIERSGYALRIDSWTGNLVSTGGKGFGRLETTEKNGSFLKVNLEIVSIEVKKE